MSAFGYAHLPFLFRTLLVLLPNSTGQRTIPRVDLKPFSLCSRFKARWEPCCWASHLPYHVEPEGGFLYQSLVYCTHSWNMDFGDAVPCSEQCWVAMVGAATQISQTLTTIPRCVISPVQQSSAFTYTQVSLKLPHKRTRYRSS